MDKLYKALCTGLLASPTEDLWSDGDRILCRNQGTAKALADFFGTEAGFFDPEEDTLSGIFDGYTGYYYVEI